MSILGLLSTVAGIFGGEAIGAVLARFGIMGFGGRAAKVLKVGRMLRKAVDFAGPSTKDTARKDLQDWLAANDPNNLTGLGDGVQ